MTDTIGLANAFGPKGTIIAGAAGFTFFYLFVPWALMVWANHNKAKFVSQHAAILGKLIDDIFLRRFINPSEWAGIAIFVACLLLACWKVFARTDFDRENERQLSFLARLVARFFN